MTGDTRGRFTGARLQLVERLFPEGIPELWCPPLTHFSDDGTLDAARIRAHLRSMRPWVRGFLVPGSTGEGWELPDAQVRELLALAIDEVGAARGHLLIGILKTTGPEAIRGVRETLAWLRARTGSQEPLEALARSSVCGFTVCPPSGSELTQEEIRGALAGVLSLGAPIALYQLPQVTRNEMSPETVAALADGYSNFYLLKDTSGADRVAASGFRGAFLVRGAEGEYATHLVGSGGKYDGFLLSTANCFGRELAQLVADVHRGNREAAEAFSARLTALCDELFDLGAKIGFGNPFTNANKAMDHYFAFGPGAAGVPPPRLCSGRRLPRDLVDAAGAALERHGLMPRRGYLEQA